MYKNHLEGLKRIYRNCITSNATSLREAMLLFFVKGGGIIRGRPLIKRWLLLDKIWYISVADLDL